MPNDNTHHAEPCAAANPAIASRLQSDALVGRVAELGPLAAMHTHMNSTPTELWSAWRTNPEMRETAEAWPASLGEGEVKFIGRE